MATHRSLLAVGAAALVAQHAMAEIAFAPLMVPTGAQRHKMLSTDECTMGGNNHTIRFHKLMSSGEQLPTSRGATDAPVFGGMIDINGDRVFRCYADDIKPLVAAGSLPGVPADTAVEFMEGCPFGPGAVEGLTLGRDISMHEDFTSLLKFSTDEGDALYSVVQFESPRPGTMDVMKLEQDPATGMLTPTSLAVVDWAPLGGLWIPCAGSVTPWQSHMGSEEYEPDAKSVDPALVPDLETFCGGNCAAAFMSDSVDFNKANILEFMRYFGASDPINYPGGLTWEHLQEVFKPYRYGYVTETTVDPATGVATPMKRYAMGRRSNELGYVMPDNKTVYMTDDGTNDMLSMFVADTPGDLSAGELFAAKLNQDSAENGGTFTIEWVSLGRATDDEIIPLTTSLTFSDIFEVAEPVKGDLTTEAADASSGVRRRSLLQPKSWELAHAAPEAEETGIYMTVTCPEGFTSVNTGDSGLECLKLKEGMEVAASRLETRRYGGMLGATTEFSKMEGFTYDPPSGKGYLAMSEIRRGMEDFMSKGKPSDKYDLGGSNALRLPYNKCGCVYALTFDDAYRATAMEGLLCGKPMPGDAFVEPSDADEITLELWAEEMSATNACELDGLANPDNIAVIPGKNLLFIGEDTVGGHQNDYVWSADLATTPPTLTRIMSTPYGAESTSVYWHELNGWGYIIAAAQHPYVESDQDELGKAGSTGLAGYAGYLGPIPINEA